MIPVRSCTTLLLVVGFLSLQAQNIPLINSGEVISKGIALYDSAQYDEAIALFKTVPARDTNYVYMLTELALTHLANKSYDLAIETCHQALKKPGHHRSNLLVTLGSALDYKGDYDSSVQVFESAIKDYPFNPSLHYNLGIAHYNHKQYDQARDCFFATLKLNPFHAGSHLNLGRMAIFQGKKARAMMSFGVYLSISNADNERLVLLERFLNNEVPEESTIPFNGPAAFDKLDQIIRAKVAMEKDFKAAVPINAVTVRQFELFLQQLSLIEKVPGEPWIETYLPFYQKIQQDNLTEPFLYHLLSSTKIPEVPRWKKKNEKKLAVFYEVANVYLRSLRREKTLPPEMGFSGPVSCWYDDDNKLEAIGNRDGAGKRVGKWMFFNGNGVCTAEGFYNTPDEKTGNWTYRYGDGTTRSLENYDTGTIELFNEQGALVNRYVLKGGKVEGEVEVFYPCGQLRTRLVFEGGQRTGPVTSYFRNGRVEEKYNLIKDEMDGPYERFFSGGSLREKYFYRKGQLEGEAISYYSNGRVASKGNYAGGRANGVWSYYHADGKLERTGSYAAGEAEGEWNYYDRQGQLTEKRVYRVGKIDGENVVFHQGKKHSVSTYQAGLLIGVEYFDKSGNSVGSYGARDGTFKANGYYPDGKLRFSGGYKKGLSHGDWKTFHRNGKPHKIFTYELDTLQGEFVEYSASGALTARQNYRDGDLHGYWITYFPDGQVHREGWFQEGNKEGQWLTWHEDGTRQSDEYFIRGNSHDVDFEYNTDGKLVSAFTFRDNQITEFAYYDDCEDMTFHTTLTRDREKISMKYPNGAVRGEKSFACGYYDGTLSEYYPNGKPLSVNGVANGLWNGVHNRFFPNGVAEETGTYLEGYRAGLWTFRHFSGTLFCEGRYLDGERDSVWTYYFDNKKVSSLISFINGEKEGLTRIFNPDGILVEEKWYEGGDLMAYRVLKDGVMPAEWTPFEGDADIVATFTNGGKAVEEVYRNGVFDGPSKLYYQNGKVYREKNYRAGMDEGPYHLYYPDGKVKEKGHYTKDVLDGVVEHYDAAARLVYAEPYRLGLKNGTVVFQEGNRKTSYIYFGGNLMRSK